MSDDSIEAPGAQPPAAARPQAMQRTPITWLLIIANLAMFGVELANGADPMRPTAQQLLHLGGDFAPYTLHGEWWRLGSSMFLHFGVIHIAMNMIVLWQARFVEVLYGPIGFIAIYIAAGLLGGVASLWRAQWAVSAGASGAVFGLFGAFGAFLLMRRDRLDPALVRNRAQSLATFIAINFVYGATQTSIDMSAHIGGLITGFVVGCALLAGVRTGKQIAARGVAALAIAVGIAVGALLAMHKPFDVDGELAAFSNAEHQCLTAYDAAQKQLVAHAITGTQMVDVIKTQVLPPWHAARARLEGLHVPSQFAHAFELLDQYAKDREQSFVEDETIVAGSPSPDLSKSHDELKRKIHADLDAYSAALHP